MRILPLLIGLMLCDVAQAASAGLRDPTRPLTASRRTPSASSTARDSGPLAVPQLQLVLIGADRRYVVIDGELLTIGDSVRGLPLMTISEDAAVLNTPNGRRTLPLSLPDEP